MCGIIGLYGKNTQINGNDKRSFILEGLYIDALRGQESTGIALLPKEAGEDPSIYKRALSGPDFVEKKPTLRLIGRLGDSHGIIGHNRSSTRGVIIDENAHPFQYDHITLVHNGTVSNSEWLLKKKCEADSSVDSAQVAWAFSKSEADDLLPDMFGGFSLVWWDARDATLHFARNTEKPMYWVVGEAGDLMYFASELKMLELLITRNGLKVKKQAFFTAPHKHYIFKDPGNVEDFSTRSFHKPSAKAGKRKVADSKALQNQMIPLDPSTGSIQRGGPLAPFSTITQATSLTTKSPNTSDTDTEAVIKEASKSGYLFMSDGTKHPAESEKISRVVAGTIINCNDDRKKQADTRDLCKEVGVEPNKTFLATPKSWSTYTDENRYGYMFLRKGDLNIQVFNVSLGLWVKCGSIGSVPVVIKSFRQVHPQDGFNTVFVAEVNFETFQRMYNAWSKKREIDSREANDTGEMVEVGMLKTKYVTVEEFNDLVGGGCYNCCHTIIPADAPGVHWFGPNEEWPICPECSKSPNIISEWNKVSSDGGDHASTTTKH